MLIFGLGFLGSLVLLPSVDNDKMREVEEKKMRIAVIGAGKLGAALGESWRTKGHEVHYGVREPGNSKYQPIGKSFVVSIGEAVAIAQVIVIATPWSGTEAACGMLGDVSGKIVIDCTNPLGMGKDGLGLVMGFSTSGGEAVQGWCPGAAVFKTLNQAGFEIVAKPNRFPHTPVMFVAGDNEAHKPTVMGLVRELGLEAVDAGPLKNSRLLEAYGMLWIELALKRGQGRGAAFSLTRL